MRIAIFASDREQRYFLSRLAEEILLRRGILPELTLFPVLQDLAEEMVYQQNAFDLAIVDGARDAPSLSTLCRYSSVILIGKKEDGVTAYELGARCFLEKPVDKINLDKAITRCLPPKNEI